MTTALTVPSGHLNRLEKVGIVFLTKSLGPQDLAKHKAAVGFELEVLARKTDRFGWDAMNPAVRQRLVSDWIECLADFTVDEIQAATKRLMADDPKQATNEERVAAEINADRGRRAARLPKQDDFTPRHWPTDDEKARATKLLQEAGFAPKRFGGDE